MEKNLRQSFLVHHLPLQPCRRRLIDLIAAVFILSAGVLLAQDEVRIDKDFDFDIPIGTKVIDVGFRNWASVNVSTVKQANHLLLKWKSPDSTISWLIRVGVPKCKVTDQEFGLIALGELKNDLSCLNFTTPVEVGRVEEYLLKVSSFDYAVQLISQDGFIRSQYRLIKQKR